MAAMVMVTVTATATALAWVLALEVEERARQVEEVRPASAVAGLESSAMEAAQVLVVD